MWGPSAKFCRIFGALLALSALASPALLAGTVSSEDFNQIDALANAWHVNKNGSDQSMQASTTSAMTALMELANQNRSSAISNGYKAFGQYRNSGDLDGLRLKNSITALKMDSAGAYISKTGKESIFMLPISAYDTSYARLDPAFLRQGEAGKVAAEFEKATGMKREAFLKKMTEASQTEIKVTDPKLVDKVLSKFESFVSEIPNEEFRAKVEKEIANVPQTVRTGLISQAVQKFSVMFAGASVAPNASDIAVAPKEKDVTAAGLSAASDKQTHEAPSVAAAPAAAAKTPSTDDRNPASIVGSTVTPALVGRAEYRGIEYENLGGDAVGRVLQTALEEDKNADTIFKQISRKYRSLSASLKQQPM